MQRQKQIEYLFRMRDQSSFKKNIRIPRSGSPLASSRAWEFVAPIFVVSGLIRSSKNYHLTIHGDNCERRVDRSRNLVLIKELKILFVRVEPEISSNSNFIPDVCRRRVSDCVIELLDAVHGHRLRATSIHPTVRSRFYGDKAGARRG